MTNNDEVFFDDKSGISMEEQREILSTINGIAEKNRKRLSQGKGEEPGPQVRGKKTQINAGKSGAFFPLAVNISAVLILCAGAFFLVSFNEKIDAYARTGNAVYNLTERALIEEIRRDTEEKIAAKEVEISLIISRLEEVDSQLLLLANDYFNNTSDQAEARERLLGLQVSYRKELAVLQDERSLILENSRSREALLRAGLEERARELSAEQQRTSAELDSAMRELERLSNERERIAVIDAYLAGAFVSLGSLVQNGQYEQAFGAVTQLRHFLFNNSAASARSFQTRREFYNQSINLAETMIAINSVYGVAHNVSGGAALIELAEINAQLEQTIADMNTTIEALSSGSSGQAARLTELEGTVSALRASVSSLESGSAEKDRTISALETERDNLNRTNQTQTQEIANLRSQIDAIRQALSDN